MRFVQSLIVLFVITCATAAEKDQTARIVEQLLGVVAASDSTFVRNGDDHAGKDAAKHMRRKYEHFKDDIQTPEQFIEKCASKSELSGKPYVIKLSTGKTVPAKDWMLERLKEIRAKQIPQSPSF